MLPELILISDIHRSLLEAAFISYIDEDLNELDELWYEQCDNEQQKQIDKKGKYEFYIKPMLDLGLIELNTKKRLYYCTEKGKTVLLRLSEDFPMYREGLIDY
jgi:hypothetical protein